MKESAMKEFVDRLTPTLLKQFGLNKVRWGRNLGGLSSINYEVEADGKKYVLKQYRSINKEDILNIENAALFLHNNSIQVPVPIRNKDGALHFSSDNRWFCFYEKVPGRVLHEASFTKPALGYTALLLAKLNKLGQRCTIPLHHTTDRIISSAQINKQADSMRKVIAQKPINAEIDKLTHSLIDTKLDLLNGLVQPTTFYNFLWRKDLVHGDFHNENLVFKVGYRLPYVLDFEAVHYGHFMEDVFNFLHFGCFNSGFNPKNFDKAQCFLKAYLSRQAATPEEIDFGLRFSLYRQASSFFLEKSLYETRDQSFIMLLERDLKKITYFRHNTVQFMDSLLRRCELSK
jgi:Ser/Thr protein kinase RdoA (MazF antagonist)